MKYRKARIIFPVLFSVTFSVAIFLVKNYLENIEPNQTHPAEFFYEVC